MISHQIVWVSPSLAVPLEPLVYRRNVASFCLFFRYYFDRCSSALDELVPLPHSRMAGLLVIVIGWMIFLSPFLDNLRM